jgi:hypothetical protein
VTFDFRRKRRAHDRVNSPVGEAVGKENRLIRPEHKSEKHGELKISSSDMHALMLRQIFQCDDLCKKVARTERGQYEKTNAARVQLSAA